MKDNALFARPLYLPQTPSPRTHAQRSLRILMVCAQYRPIIGGYERAAERLATALVQRGHFVDVVTERRHRSWKRLEVEGQLRVIRTPCLYVRHLHLLTSLASLWAFLVAQRRHYDIVHVHQYGIAAALALTLARRGGCRTVLKVRSTGIQGIGAELRTFRLSSIIERAHRRIDACVAPSLASCREAVAFGIPKERVHLVPNGLDTTVYRPATAEERRALKRHHNLGDGPVVLFLARLVEAKEPLLLLDAWTLVTQAIPTARLVVVGDGPEWQRMQAHQVQASGTVRMIGESSDVVTWHQLSDLFVICSNREGLSNSLLEALSCGVPVVSTRVSGSVDLFAKADIGEMVDCGSAPLLAEAIQKLLSNPARRLNCGANARSLALRDLAVDRVAAMMEDVYRSRDMPVLPRPGR